MFRGLCSLSAAFWIASSTLTAQSSKIPTPESVVGFAPGAESKLATYDQTVEYFKKLDAASDQMMMVEAGTSTQGRTYYFALISSKDNLKKIDRYREIARRLARPEGLTEAQAVALAGCIRRKSRGRNIRCCSRTTCWRSRTIRKSPASSTTSS